MTSPSADLAGQVIASQFRIERLLGQGGMGAVYLAEQMEMGRKVVVKVMNPSQIASPDLEARFKREARAVAQLNHPNVVQVHVFGRTEDGQLYLAMEFVEGHTLTDLLKSKAPLPEARALRILDQIASALIEAHDLGLVHRDLKPDNIMLTDRHGNPDYVKVLDFGIAKMLDAPDAKLTQTGAIFGTPQYMAPEQAKGKAVDQRTDIYALGLILYEMLTGQLPFEAESTIEFLVKHMSEPPLPPTRKLTGLVMLPRTESLIMRCLEKEPAARFQSVSELQREVRQSLRDRPDSGRSFPTPEAPKPPLPAASPSRTEVLPTPTPAGPPKSQRSTRASLVLAGLGLGLVATAAGGLYFIQKGRPEPRVDAPPGALSASAGAKPEPTVTEPPTDEAPDIPEPNPEPAAAPLKPNRGADKGPPLVKPRTKQPASGPGSTDDPSTEDDLPAAAELPEGPSFEDVPAPVGARLVSSSPQALTLSADRSPAALLGFYKRHGKRLWGPYKPYPGGLQFTNETAPITYVSLSRGAGGMMVSFVRNVMVERPKARTARTVFGVPVPAGAEATVETPTAAVFQLDKPIEGVIAFYRRQYAGKPGITFVETQVDGAPYLVVTAQNEALPFSNLAVMRTPESLQPGPGNWTQITLSK